VEIFGENLVLIEKVAAGGMGEIFLAKLLGKGGFEKSVAVKRIHPRIASDAEFQALFANEVQLSALLHHPNIIQAFGNGEIDGYLYLVMEFIDGCTLHKLFRKLHPQNQKIPVDLALLILCQACEGLGYAHDLKDENTGRPFSLIHRDLSPDNIMLSYLGMLKIVDFGVVKTDNSQHTKTGTLKGKIAYMSPEQATGEVLDRRSDIFSLFVIFWECLAGERFFPAQKSELLLLKSVERSEFPDLKEKVPDLRPELHEMLRKGLARDRGLRYNSCEEVVRDVRSYLLKYHPETDRQKLSEYLHKQFAEEIAMQHSAREKNRPEAERFIQGARLQLESKLLSQSKLMAGYADPADEDSATKISQIPSFLYNKKSLEFSKGSKNMIAVLVVVGITIGVLGGFIYWERYRSARLPASIAKATNEQDETDEFVPGAFMHDLNSMRKIDVSSGNLPEIDRSRFSKDVVRLDTGGYKRQVLVPAGTRWKYWDRAKPLPSNWTDINFDDTEWKAGAAPLGYGDPMRTYTSFGSDPESKIITQYFRHYFDLKNKEDLSTFILLGLRRDDGAIVYVNGKSVFSDNFKSEPVDSKALALVRLDTPMGEIGINYDNIPKNILVEGKNIIAVEVHQADVTSSDLAMDLFLLGWSNP
jgi:serine/threonine protein kinase